MTDETLLAAAERLEQELMREKQECLNTAWALPISDEVWRQRWTSAADRCQRTIDTLSRLRAALGQAPRQCPWCQGRGTRVQTYDDYGIADPKDVRCGICDGVGRVVPAP